MNLEDKLSMELKSAMKAKHTAKVRSIRAVKAAIMLAKTDGSGKDVTEADGIKIVQKLIKQRRDSLDIYEKQNREDLAKIEREEIEVLSDFLPKQFSEAELIEFLTNLIEKVGATSIKDMGKVMGIASKELAGQADGKSISSVVKRLLT